MNCIVPFAKDIEFNTNISEITSISLEHEITVNESALLGNFLLSGEYKSHEVSVNTDAFNFTLPFDVALPENLDKTTINFDINDFTYSIKDNNQLHVEIEFVVNGEETRRNKDNDMKTIASQEPLELDISDENIREDSNSNKSEVSEPIVKENEENVLGMASESDETFVTYKIHIVKNGENVNSICADYKELGNLISEYNDLSDIHVGDKIIIPVDE